MSKLFNSVPDVMERFDFEQVHKVMIFLNWTWSGIGVPSVEQLRSEAMHLLDTAILEYEKSSNKDIGMEVATGGFIAQVVTYAKAEPRLALTFYVDHTTGLNF
jgi:hypothetical protein